jgi:predicted nucleic acid-binding protein
LLDQRRLERELQRFTLHWPTLADCQRAYQDFAAYHLSHGIELLDVLIGHTAVGLNEPLATFNVKHYGVIPGLQTIQPY